MEIGVVEQVILPPFTVIGKLGEGLAAEGSSWVPPLWQSVEEHFDQLVNELEEKNATPQFWGLMSEKAEWLAPWQKVGNYLAGLEVSATTQTPLDWYRWDMPQMECFIVKTNDQLLEETTEKVLTDIIPQAGRQLVAAIQECYPADYAQGEVLLVFPLKIM